MPDETPDIHERHLDGLAGGDAVLRGMLDHALSRAIAKDARTTRGTAKTEVDPAVAAVMAHVRDWLAVDLADGAHWLSRTDRNGVPAKLAKISSFEQASNEADKAMRRRLSRGFDGTAAEAGEGTEIRAVLADGWSVVALLTPEALDAESHAMQHCIGQGYYDSLLRSGRSVFMSLRDPHGAAHVTIQATGPDMRIEQIQGKQNEFPDPKYVRILRPFLKDGFAMEGALASQLGFVRGTGDALHDVDDLPDVFETDRDLDLSECTGRLPRRIRTGGYLILPHGLGGDVFETELDVAGSLKITGATFRRFAHPPKVGGTLGLHAMPNLEELHPDTEFGDRISLTYAPMLRSLPGGTGFAGSIKLTRTAVTELPDDVRDLAHLEIEDCPFEALPADLVVRGTTSLADCPLPVLPGSIRFGGKVRISGTVLRLVERNAFGDDLEIVRPSGRGASEPVPMEIEDGTTVAGSLALTGVDLPKGLPSRLRVGRELHVSKGSIGRGGRDVSVGGRAYFRVERMEALPAGLRVGEDLLVRGARRMEIGEDTVVGRDLTIDRDIVRSLPRDLVVGGRIRASMSNVAGIGEGFSVGILDPAIFSDAAVLPEGMRVGTILDPAEFRGRLPKGLRVEGDLDLSDFDPDEVPEGLEVGGELVGPGSGRSPGF